MKAAVVLHNMLLIRLPSYCPTNYDDIETATGIIVPGQWRKDSSSLPSISPGNKTRSCSDAWKTREAFSRYFSGEGAVSWQVAYVTDTGCNEDLENDSEYEDYYEEVNSFSFKKLFSDSCQNFVGWKFIYDD